MALSACARSAPEGQGGTASEQVTLDVWGWRQEDLLQPLVAAKSLVPLDGRLQELAGFPQPVVDGANEGRLFVSIALPLMRPALAVVTVFRFAPTWHNIFYPLVLLRSDTKHTVPVGLTRFFGEFATDRATLFAGLVIAVVPPALVFAFATTQIIAGLTAGMSR
jgi:hypothetical protein